MSKSFGLHSLDENVANIICSHLSAYDLSSLAATSTICNSLASHDALWQSFTQSKRGYARRNHLRTIAWKAAKATHNVETTHTTSPINSIHLLRNGVVCASLSQSHSTVHTHHASFYSAADDALDALPLCAAFSDDICAPYSYLAYAYSNHTVKLFSIHQQTRMASAQQITTPFGTETITCMHTISQNNNGHLIVVGTSAGDVIVFKGCSQNKIAISPSAISCLFSTDQMLIVGTKGGEVYTVDINRSTTKQLFVGPCPCPITTVHKHHSILIAGIRHVVPGNGHTCAAVAWNTQTCTRLSSFARSRVARSSSALPPMPTQAVRVSAERAALLVDGDVLVFELGDWRCIIAAHFEEAVDVAMDQSRLAVGCADRVHVLDFEHALRQWPHQLPHFKPPQRV
ncbi:unnamed protein product [Agarophyton chilense]